MKIGYDLQLHDLSNFTPINYEDHIILLRLYDPNYAKYYDQKICKIITHCDLVSYHHFLCIITNKSTILGPIFKEKLFSEKFGDKWNKTEGMNARFNPVGEDWRLHNDMMLVVNVTLSSIKSHQRALRDLLGFFRVFSGVMTEFDFLTMHKRARIQKNSIQECLFRLCNATAIMKLQLYFEIRGNDTCVHIDIWNM